MGAAASTPRLLWKKRDPTYPERVHTSYCLKPTFECPTTQKTTEPDPGAPPELHNTWNPEGNHQSWEGRHRTVPPEVLALGWVLPVQHHARAEERNDKDSAL